MAWFTVHYLSCLHTDGDLVRYALLVQVSYTSVCVKVIRYSSTAFLDPEWFTFETAGTLVAGMDGVTNRQENKSGNRPAAAMMFSKQNTMSGVAGIRQSLKVDRENTAVSGIEMAAAAATGG